MSKHACVNPALVDYFKKIGFPKYQYGYRHIARPLVCQDILKKLDLKPEYPDLKKLDIIDIFSGFGLFSTMINYQLKPRNHIIVEEGKENVKIWKERIKYLEEKTGNSENFKLYPKNGYNWGTYESMINDDKLISPNHLLRDKPSDELLIIGNLTPLKFGESLLAQWIMCSAYRNWLQKYGRVRMVCFVPDVTAQKFLSGIHFHKRNKSAIKRELFTDSRLIAIVESLNSQFEPDGYEYDPNLLVKDQPVVIPSRAILPPNTLLAVIEIIPKDIPLLDFDLFEYILQILMYRSTGKLSEALLQFSPGALTDLGPKIPSALLNKSPRNISKEEFLFLFDVIDKWAFKPSLVDTLGIIQEETKNF